MHRHTTDTNTFFPLGNVLRQSEFYRGLSELLRRICSIEQMVEMFNMQLYIFDYYGVHLFDDTHDDFTAITSR